MFPPTARRNGVFQHVKIISRQPPKRIPGAIISVINGLDTNYLGVLHFLPSVMSCMYNHFWWYPIRETFYEFLSRSPKSILSKKTSLTGAEMSLYALIPKYGYLAVGIGTFLEGETILILGGFAAHQGYLRLSWVLVSAFVGTVLGDQLYYYIGRTKGRDVLERRPKWRYKSEKVTELLRRHDALIIMGFRFLYGLRTVTPFVIGLSKIAPIRFLLFNILGASIWAIVFGSSGYILGHTFEKLLRDIENYELYIFAVCIVISLLFIIYRHFFNHRHAT